MSAASSTDVEVKSPTKRKRLRRARDRFTKLLEPEVLPEHEPDETLKKGFDSVANFALKALGVLHENEVKQITEHLTKVS